MVATFLIGIFLSNALPLFFLARSSEYDFIMLDTKMIFHYYLLYRIKAGAAVNEGELILIKWGRKNTSNGNACKLLGS
jgi:hypothetical protein